MKLLFAKFWNQDNLFAPISMICGLAAWTILPFIGAMAAIFTGHIAYAKAKRLRVSGKGAALTGLIMGYSGLALATVLLGVWLALPPEISLLGRPAQDAAVTQTATAPPQATHLPANKPQRTLLNEIPPAAEPILAVQAWVEEQVKQGTPLNQIDLNYVLSEEQKRYWQRIEVQQGTLIATPLPDKHGLAVQVMILSVLNGKKVEWACVGQLPTVIQQAICDG